MRSIVLGVAGLVFLTACDGVFTPEERTPSELSRNTLPASPAVGEAVEAQVTVRDAGGRIVAGEPVAWTATGGGSVAPGSSSTDAEGVASTTWTLGTVAGEQTLTATVREMATTFVVVAVPGAVTRLEVSPASAVLTSLGDSLQLTLDATDAHGNTFSPGAAIWSSSSPAVAEVTPAGIVIAHQEGAVEVTATIGGMSAAVPVQVDQVVVGIGIDVWTDVLARTETVQLESRAVDARGATVDTALTIAWTSSAPTVAAVSGSGLLEAVDVGTAVITASAPPLAGQRTVQVKAGPRPAISGITPSVLHPGATATIAGTGFSSTASANRVTVAGVEATVTGASASALTVTMPPAGSFPCGATGPREVVVTVDGLAAPTDHPVAGAPQRALAVGEAATFAATELGCNEIVSAGSYVLTVYNASTSPSATTAFQVQGAGGGAAAAPVAFSTAGGPAFRVDPAPAPASPEDAAIRSHLRLLERNRALFDRLGRPGRAGGLSQLQVSAAPAEVGDLRTFRVPDIDGEDLCTEFESVTARVVYAGPKAVIYEDTAAPLAGTMDARWQTMGVEFDNVMYPILLQYFGDPLAYDAQLDGDGRLNMLFSEFVNELDAGVAGFVFSGDFYARPQCGSSDGGEIFYGRVPTATGSGYDGYTEAAWAWGIRSTIIHEVKHITSYALKIRDAGTGAPNFEEQWLEESTARLSEEFYGRALFGYGRAGNVGYQESIYCEIRVGTNWPECDPYPSIMVKHFGAVNDYMKAMESLSIIGKVGTSDWSFYGSGWLFVRWALDQSGALEADFVRALMDEDGVTGVANIEVRTGRSFRDLLADFTLALATDDHPSGVVPGDPAHAHPGWDTRDIFAGLHEDYAGGPLADRYDRAWPLRSQTLPAGAFATAIPSLRGGSATVFEMTVPAGNTQLLRVLSATGGTAPSVLGMALMRVQ